MICFLVFRLLLVHIIQRETIEEDDWDAGDKVERANDKGAALQGDTAGAP